MKKGIARLGLIWSFGLFTTHALANSISDLLISEVMPNPAALSDTAGEWFELYNPTGDQINLRGIDLGDDGRDWHHFDSDLLIPPQHYVTLARGSTPGFVPDYVYDSFTLSNISDEIVFRDVLGEMLRLDYGSGFSAAGRSRELRQLPMVAGNYDLTLATLTYGLGDIGTPGAAGSAPLAPSAVPVPAAIWLFISGLLGIFTFIPARAGGSKTPVASIPRPLTIPVSNRNLQS